jgi:hypothetical protein
MLMLFATSKKVVNIVENTLSVKIDLTEHCHNNSNLNKHRVINQNLT